MRPLPRLIVALVAAAAAAAAAPIGAAELDRGALMRLAPSVVKIEAVDAEGRFQLGSGVIVGPGTLVTNCHVTRRAQRLQAVKNGVRRAATAQSADVERDLCLLKVPGLEGEPVPIGHAEALKSGQGLLAIGYTGGLGIQLSTGEVVALHRMAGSRIIQSSNWFTSGASGGGLFNAEGELVGILTFRLRGGAAHYFAAPADWLLERLDDEPRFAAVGPLAGQTFWEAPADAQPYFLQAAALEQTRQWTGLLQLAQRWQQGAAQDPEAAYVMGVAYDGLRQIDDSIRALQHCVALDPSYHRGWARLAQVYQGQGRRGEAQHALAQLASIDESLAHTTRKELENKP
jgi:serine protease Do